MRTIYIFTIILLLLTGCQKSKKEQDSNINLSKTLIVDSSCVIIRLPDSTEIESMHKQHSKEEYESWVSSVTWYPGIAASELNDLGIRNIPCHDIEYIILRKNGKEAFRIALKDMDQDIILYNVNKKPFFIHSSEFEVNKNFIIRYFDKK